MSTCAACGIDLIGDITLCFHHQHRSDDWARENRLMCDLLHRGLVAGKPAERERLPRPGRDAVLASITDRRPAAA
jgi:hypothetical protein